jgi:hypothetical protein
MKPSYRVSQAGSRIKLARTVGKKVEIQMNLVAYENIVVV